MSAGGEGVLILTLSTRCATRGVTKYKTYLLPKNVSNIAPVESVVIVGLPVVAAIVVVVDDVPAFTDVAVDVGGCVVVPVELTSEVEEVVVVWGAVVVDVVVGARCS